MNLSQLIETLTDLAEQHGPDAEVRLMSQSNYPFEYSLAGVTDLAAIWDAEKSAQDEDDDNPEMFDPEGVDEDTPVVYLLEGQQLGYGTSAAWQAAIL